nr:hypothetical protein [Tanacetum cinerariifolium]
MSTPMDTSEKLMPNNSQVVYQLEYSRVIDCLVYAMTCTRPDIAFAVGKLSSNTEDNLSTSGWVFLLVDGKEAEWLRNLILEIPLWSKPIAPISIRCDSAVTLAKAYSQMYNGKSRYLCVRHNMIRELITNGVVSIEFVPMDTSEKLMPNNSEVVSQLEYSRVIGCLVYAMTYTRPDIAFAVVLEGYIDASWISNTEDNSSTSGWVFLLGEVDGKEAEWLRNLILEIPLWSKPIAPISIRCDSAVTLAKAYS